MEYIAELYIKLASALTALAIILGFLGGPPSAPGGYLASVRSLFLRKVAAPVTLRLSSPASQPPQDLQYRAGQGEASEWGYVAKAAVKAQGIGD